MSFGDTKEAYNDGYEDGHNAGYDQCLEDGRLDVTPIINALSNLILDPDSPGFDLDEIELVINDSIVYLENI